MSDPDFVAMATELESVAEWLETHPKMDGVRGDRLLAIARQLRQAGQPGEKNHKQ